VSLLSVLAGLSAIDDTPKARCITIEAAAGDTFWGALVEAESNEERIAHQRKAIDTPETCATAAQAGCIAPQQLGLPLPVTPKAPATAAPATPALSSAADLEFLRSLDAKIKALTEAGTAKPLGARPRRGDAARVPGPPTLVASSPTIDSTQTVRPLTSLELADGEASRWFAIQLLLSADQIDAAQVPNLDIFEDYRLYSVTEPEQGRLMHALRLGFFSNQVAAESVARYLAIYFGTPIIKRVSIAECERFADKLITAGKDIGASGTRAVIELVGSPMLLPEGRIAPAARRGASGLASRQ
jgi:hypothetical protein